MSCFNTTSSSGRVVKKLGARDGWLHDRCFLSHNLTFMRRDNIYLNSPFTNAAQQSQKDGIPVFQRIAPIASCLFSQDAAQAEIQDLSSEGGDEPLPRRTNCRGLVWLGRPPTSESWFLALLPAFKPDCWSFPRLQCALRER